MRRRGLAAIILSVLAACSQGQLDVTTSRSDALPSAETTTLATTATTSSTTSSTTVPEPFEVMTTDDDLVPNEVYSFSIEIVTEIEGSPVIFSLAGGYDPAANQGLYEISTRDLLLETGLHPDEIDVASTDVVTMVHFGDNWFVRGLIPELGYPAGVDVDTWYEDSPFDDDSTDLLRSQQTRDEIIAMMDGVSLIDVTETVVRRLGEDVLMAATLSEADLDLIGDDSIVNFISGQTSADVEFGFDQEGRIVRFSAEYVRRDEVGSVEMIIAGYGVPLHLPTVMDQQPLPVDEERPPVVPIEPTDPLDSSPTLRFSTYLGYQSGTPDVAFVVESDGDVLRIDEGDIYAGPSSYTTWNIGVDGYDFVASSLRSSGLADAPADGLDGAPAGSIRAGEQLVFSAHGLDLGRNALTEEQFQVREQFEWQLAQIALTQGRADDVRPWVPSHLTLEIRSEYNPQYYVTEDFLWPFDQPINEMTGAGTHVCLDGANAALAWKTFLVDGVNNARIPVTDGTQHELSVNVSTPGYQRSSDPCPGVQDIDGGGNAAAPTASVSLPQHIVDPLLTVLDDRSSDGVEDTPPPPRLDACGAGTTPTASEENTQRFDRLMMRRHTVVLPTGDDLDLLAGFVTTAQLSAGFDLDALVRGIADFAPCENPFAEYGISNFSAGQLTDLPTEVTAGSYWMFDRPGMHTVVADISVRGRIAMVVSLSSVDPLAVDDITQHLDFVAAMLPVFDDGLAACNATPIEQHGASCDGSPEW